jgi:hypothetical protein
MPRVPTPAATSSLPVEPRSAALRPRIGVLIAFLSLVLVAPARSAIEPAPGPGAKPGGTAEAPPTPSALSTRGKPSLAPPTPADPITPIAATRPTTAVNPLSEVQDLTGGLSERGTRFVSTTTLALDAPPPAGTTVTPTGKHKEAFDPLSPLGLAIGGASMVVLVAAGWYLSRRRT